MLDGGLGRFSLVGERVMERNAAASRRGLLLDGLGSMLVAVLLGCTGALGGVRAGVLCFRRRGRALLRRHGCARLPGREHAWLQHLG